ncbi:hypothetical protein O9929_03725 [Vibrio lentus]|nr:hypothetical protein [Vibrio lentus]
MTLLITSVLLIGALVATLARIAVYSIKLKSLKMSATAKINGCIEGGLEWLHLASPKMIRTAIPNDYNGSLPGQSKVVTLESEAPTPNI